MALFLVFDKQDNEWVYKARPHRDDIRGIWYNLIEYGHRLYPGTIEKLIGRKLTWEDEPVELKSEK